jgi:RHS repeat-associated protein
MRKRLSVGIWMASWIALAGATALASQGPELARVEALWVAESEGVLKVARVSGGLLLEIPEVPEARGVAVDPRREAVWVYAGRELSAWSFRGERRLAVEVPLPSPSHALLGVTPEDGSVWLGVGRTLTSFSQTGARLAAVELPGNARSLAFDAGRSRVWVGMGEGAAAYDTATGDLVLNLALDGSPGLSALDVDPETGAVWVAEREGLRRFGTDGSPELVVAVRGLVAVAAASGGSAWVATAKDVLRIGPAGEVLGSARPLGGRGVIVGLVADPVDGSFWAANATEIAHGGPDGALVHLLEPDPPVHIRSLALYADTFPPELAFTAPAPGAVVATAAPEIALEWSDLGTGVDPATLELALGGAVLPVACEPREAGASCLPSEPLAAGPAALTATVRDFRGNLSAPAVVAFTVELGGGLPPDPSTVAPPLDPTVATDLAKAAEFLYAGADPIQREADPGAFEPHRVAVLRGRVLDASRAPLPGVEVSVLGHPELGHTLSRLDGVFDLAVNGGGPVVLDYRKPGHLPAQRRVDAPWRDYAWAEDAVLLAYDPEVTRVALGASAFQVARGSLVEDGDGARRATLLFPPGTTAALELPDGSVQELPALSVRATEYTVGPGGPAAMPGPLPPNVAYTYAVELSADEAVAAGARRVAFSRPVSFYLENFLGFPVGRPVPAGYYDRELAAWVPSDDGRIVAVLGITEGLAELDVTGAGTSSDPTALAALGITDEERHELALLYPPGRSLWRVPIPHFTPWDCNWPYGPPEDAEVPDQPAPERADPPEEAEEQPDCQAGSILECQNRVLREALALPGTGRALHYRSDRTRGNRAAFEFEVPLTGAEVPDSLKRVQLKVEVAGRRFEESFPPLPSQRTTFAWDGHDAYGRRVQGEVPVDFAVGYTYDMEYYDTTAAFGRSWASVGSSSFSISGRTEVTLWQRHEANLRTRGGYAGLLEATAYGLGGWTLDIHHAYDLGRQVLHLGTGEVYGAVDFRDVIETIAGGGALEPADGVPAREARLRGGIGVAVAPDGRVALAIYVKHQIFWVERDGTLRLLAGTGEPGYSGNGGPATEARLLGPSGLSFGPDGSLYFIEIGAVRRIRPGGAIEAVAGNGQPASSGDGGPATEALLGARGIAVAPDGTVYVSERRLHGSVIRQITPDGRIQIFAGGGRQRTGSEIPARDVYFESLAGIALGPEGSLFVVDTSRVWRIHPNGRASVFAGIGVYSSHGDGLPATQAALVPHSVSVASDGSVFLNDYAGSRVRKVRPDGLIESVAGTSAGFSGDGGPGRAARLYRPVDIALGPDGSLVIEDQWNNRIRRVRRRALPGFREDGYLIASRSGNELYEFDADGRHLRTVHPLTGKALFSFSYDPAGRLASVVDGDGLATLIERGSAGRPRAVVGPYGARTELTVDANGWLSSLRSPAGDTFTLRSTPEGLLESWTDPRGHQRQYTFADTGHLVAERDPAGAVQRLEVSDLADGYQVLFRSGEGRTRRYQVLDLDMDGRMRVNVSPEGLVRETWIAPDGRTETREPDGSRSASRFGPDPRFGMLAPVLAESRLELPSGLAWSLTLERTADFADPQDPSTLLALRDLVRLNGAEYRRVYDAARRESTWTTPAGRLTSVSLDPHGRPLRVAVGGLAPLEYTWDAHGRLASIEQGAGDRRRVLRLGWGESGWLSGIADPLSRTVGFEVDADGRPLVQTLPDGREVRFTYEPGGGLATLTPPGRPAHAFRYTPVDLPEAYQPPDLGLGPTETTYAYDLDRKIAALARPDGKAVSFDRDAAGRLAALRFSEGEVRAAYDPATGQLARFDAPGGVTTTYAYDGFLLKGTTWSGPVQGTVELTYDENLRVVGESVNGELPVVYGYDADGLLTRAGPLTLTRDPANGLVTATAVGQVATHRSYNEFGELTGTSASFGETPLFAAEYERDRLGRIVRKTETVLGATDVYDYAYDLAGRLTEVVKNGSRLSLYEYDANGNRLAHATPAGRTEAAYDDQDRLLLYGDASFEHTASGELVSKTRNGHAVTYGYDELGALRSVVLPDGLTTEYLVDGEGRRVGTKVAGALVRGYLYLDRLRPAAELDGDGRLLSRFVYATRPNVPDVLLRNDSVYAVVLDPLGSPRLLVNAATGEVVQRMDFDEFGNVVFDSNPGWQPFGFAGGLYEAGTGLVRFGARDYAAAYGIWSAKDPLLFGGGSGNLYEYAAGDPVNGIDYDGRAVKNNCSCTVYVKPESIKEPVQAIPVPPGGVYEGRNQDGIAVPWRPGQVFKTTDLMDATIHPDGTITTESNLGGAVLLPAAQAVLGGWKGQDFLEERRDAPDLSWDPLFSMFDVSRPVPAHCP